MGERGTLAISVVLLATLAVGSYWLAEQARKSDAPTRKPGHDIDYTAKDISLTRMDDAGRAAYTVDADALVHFADDDTGELTQPRIVGSKVDRPVMRVRADLGKTTSDAEEVRLYGNVVFNRAPWRGNAAMQATGPYMLVYPDREVLSSDQPVRIVQGGSSVDANGMYYDNGTRRLELEGGKSGRIRNVIEPRAARAARAGTAPDKAPR